LADIKVDFCITNARDYIKCSNLSSIISAKLPRVEFRALLFVAKLLHRYGQWIIDISKLSSLLSTGMHHMTVSTSEDRGIVKGEKIRGKKMSVLAKTPPIEA
jgi:hypothetical protein